MFQDRLQKLREQHGYSVKEAAAALHLPYTTYNQTVKYCVGLLLFFR